MNTRTLLLTVIAVLSLELPLTAQTWEVQVSGTTDVLMGVSFVDSTCGWAVGGGSGPGTILNTTDGGVTWTPQNSGTEWELNRVAFASRNVGWAVGINGSVLHTNDGGVHWDSLAFPVSVSGIDVAVIDDSTCWLVGGSTTAGVGAIRTTDNGATWSVFNTGYNFTVKGMAFADANHGWIVGRDGFVVCTHDGGLTWTRQGQTVFNNYVFDGAFVDSATGWLVGLHIIGHTTDGGTTWTLQDCGTASYIAAAEVIDANHGWIVGFQQVMRTTDAGETWTSVQLPTTTPGHHDVSFVDANHGWIVGDNGSILRYVPPTTTAPSVEIIPKGFALEQNYPNPFNATTTLRFNLLATAQVSLDIFDLGGRRVQTVYNGMLGSGNHSFPWTCANCASGTYVVRLNANGNSAQNRILLLK